MRHRPAILLLSCLLPACEDHPADPPADPAAARSPSTRSSTPSPSNSILEDFRDEVARHGYYPAEPDDRGHRRWSGRQPWNGRESSAVSYRDRELLAAGRVILYLDPADRNRPVGLLLTALEDDGGLANLRLRRGERPLERDVQERLRAQATDRRAAQERHARAVDAIFARVVGLRPEALLPRGAHRKFPDVQVTHHSDHRWRRTTMSRQVDHDGSRIVLKRTTGYAAGWPTRSVRYEIFFHPQPTATAPATRAG